MRGLERGGLPSARHCRSSSPYVPPSSHLFPPTWRRFFEFEKLVRQQFVIRPSMLGSITNNLPLVLPFLLALRDRSRGHAETRTIVLHRFVPSSSPKFCPWVSNSDRHVVVQGVSEPTVQLQKGLKRPYGGKIGGNDRAKVSSFKTMFQRKSSLKVFFFFFLVEGCFFLVSCFKYKFSYQL